jgi:hypothetical protein
MNEYNIKKKILIHYLQIYLSKKRNMNIVFVGIVKKLKSNQKITIKQFNSLLSYLKLETQFLKFNRNELKSYFSSLIEINNNIIIQRKTYESNDLTPFFA